MEEMINKAAKEAATGNVCKYAPDSYKAGFVEGAKWMYEHFNKNLL